MPKARLISPQDGSRLQALDLRTLGRPLHLLPRFAEALRQELAECFDQTLNRRYRAAFHIRTLRQDAAGRGQARAQWHALGDWRLSAQLDRSLLLRILDYRFGASAPAVPDALPAPTETERRLERRLAELLLPRLRRCIRQLAGLDDDAAPAAPASPAEAAWEIRLDIADGDIACGELRLLLCGDAFEALLQSLSTQRSRGERLPEPDGKAFAERLQVRLRARLLEQELPLGDILDLTPGAILPVKLQARADVCVRDSRLFSADVAESHGKLCLTGFDDCA
ncbi:flagellar motor switch protein FliM [Xenophilus sp. AP218F]|nr:FliM/FliN family flagellar motor C-terminal domain-containing protein [Chromobacterium sp. ASV5]OWY39965.1 flagellar motor switch protein FliM [Xenophilus sp. AP218F]